MHSYIGFQLPEISDKAHLTLLYLGEDVAKNRLALATEFVTPFIFDSWLAKRHSIDMFGPNKNVPVLRVSVSQGLQNLRVDLVEALGNVSEFKDWQPHITLHLDSEYTIHLPREIQLDDLGVFTS